jgi:hypothetical protein
MNPVPAPGTSFTFGASGGTGATGTYTGGVGQATGTFYNADNLQKTRDIFDIRFPSYLHKTVVKGGHERNLSEF